MFSCCTRTRSKCCLLFLPEAKLLLYFLELLIVNLRVLREAKYIPLVNEEINLFKSCLGGSGRKAACGRAQGVVTPISASVVARPALVGVHELTPLSMSPDLARAASLAPAPYNALVLWLRRDSPGHAGKDVGCPGCSAPPRRPSPRARSRAAEWLVY